MVMPQYPESKNMSITIPCYICMVVQMIQSKNMFITIQCQYIYGNATWSRVKTCLLQYGINTCIAMPQDPE